MMIQKIFNFFSNANIILQFTISLFTFLGITSIGSLIFTGNFFEWIKNPFFEILSISLILIVILVFIRSYRFSKWKNWRPTVGCVIPWHGYEEIGEELFSDVLWTVRIPRVNKYQMDSFLRQPNKAEMLNQLSVKIPPLCPKCKTELEEERTMLGKYPWKCIRCPFTKKSKNSFNIEVERAKKYIKSLAREEIETGEGSLND